MGIVFVEQAFVEATSGQMRVTFQSGGEEYRFHLEPHIALRFREAIIRDSWQVLCAPDAEVVPMAALGRKRKAQ